MGPAITLYFIRMKTGEAFAHSMNAQTEVLLGLYFYHLLLPKKKKKSRITWLRRIRHRESVYLFPGSLIQRLEMVARIIISILDGGGLVFCRPHSHLSPDLFDFLSALESGSGFQEQRIVRGRGRGTKMGWVPSTSITYILCENLSMTLQVNYFSLYSTEEATEFPSTEQFA